MFQRAITIGLLVAFLLMAMPVTSQAPQVASITIDWDYSDQSYRVTFTEAVSASDVAILITDVSTNQSENITDGNGLSTESSTA